MEAILIAGVCTGTLVALAVWVHYESKKQLEFSVRKSKMAYLKQFRLSKMLGYLGIDIEKYVEHMPPQSQWMHLNNCQHCPNTIECDQHLSEGKPILDMNFCPNYVSLIRHSDERMRAAQ